MNTAQQIANMFNTSSTGCIATVVDDHVSVQVPCLILLSGGKSTKGYQTEVVYSIEKARRILRDMQ